MADTASASAAADSSAKPHNHTISIRLWPKIPVLYPVALAALICGIISLNSPVGSQTQHVVAIAFLGVLAFSLFTLTIDVGFTWALAWALGVVIVGLLLFIVNIYTTFLKDILPFLANFKPEINAHAYFTVVVVWLLLMLVGFIIARFHYVKVEPNEIIMVGGVLDKRRRYSTTGVRYTKEITDVFEYYLPFIRAGRLVLRFPNEEEPVILENVLHMDQVIKRMEEITSVMQVAPESTRSEG